MQCKALTTSGSQCSRKADINSNYCWQHQNYEIKSNTKITSPKSAQTIFVESIKSISSKDKNMGDHYFIAELYYKHSEYAIGAYTSKEKLLQKIESDIKRIDHEYASYNLEKEIGEVLGYEFKLTDDIFNQVSNTFYKQYLELKSFEEQLAFYTKLSYEKGPKVDNEFGAVAILKGGIAYTEHNYSIDNIYTKNVLPEFIYTPIIGLQIENEGGYLSDWEILEFSTLKEFIDYTDKQFPNFPQFKNTSEISSNIHRYFNDYESGILTFFGGSKLVATANSNISIIDYEYSNDVNSLVQIILATPGLVKSELIKNTEIPIDLINIMGDYVDITKAKPLKQKYDRSRSPRGSPRALRF
jgi:hypothetical protein